MPDTLVIRRESPDQTDVRAALGSLDDYLASLYPAEANHILGVQALLEPAVRFFVARAGAELVGTGAVRCMPGEPATGVGRCAAAPRPRAAAARRAARSRAAGDRARPARGGPAVRAGRLPAARALRRLPGQRPLGVLRQGAL